LLGASEQFLQAVDLLLPVIEQPFTLGRIG